jgi:hypothetical protein
MNEIRPHHAVAGIATGVLISTGMWIVGGLMVALLI